MLSAWLGLTDGKAPDMSGPDAGPWGRSQLLTFGAWVLSEWWGSIYQAFFLFLFLLLLLLKEP